MADTTTTQDPAEIEQQGSDRASGQEAGGASPKKGDQFSTNGDAIMVGGRYRQVYEISVDNGPRKKMGWRIHEGSEVKIYGSYLDIYHQITLVINDSPYDHKNLHPKQDLDDRTTISFVVTKDIKGLYSDASLVYLRFVGDNPSDSRSLKEEFKYFAETEEEKQKRGKPSGKEAGDEGERQQAGKGPELVSAVINAGLGPLGAVAEGLKSTAQASSAGAKTLGQGAAAAPSTAKQVSSQGTIDEGGDYDNEITSEVEGEASAQAAASTAEVSAGGQTISQGGTVSAATAGEVSTGGTVTGLAGGQVAPSGTVKASQEVGASGTVSQTQRTQVASGGTVSAGARVTSQGPAAMAGGGTVSGKVTGTAEAREQVSSTGGGVGGGRVGGGGVSGTVSAGSQTISQGSTVEAGGGVASSGAAAAGAVSGQAAAKAGAKTEAKAEGTVEASAKVKAAGKAEVSGGAAQAPAPAPSGGAQAEVSGEVGAQVSGPQGAVPAPPPVQTAPQQPLSGKGKVDGIQGAPPSTAEAAPVPAEPKIIPKAAPATSPKVGQAAKPPAQEAPAAGIQDTLSAFKKRESELNRKLGKDIAGAPDVIGGSKSKPGAPPPLTPASGGLGAEKKEAAPGGEKKPEDREKRPGEGPGPQGRPLEDQSRPGEPGAPGLRQPGEGPEGRGPGAGPKPTGLPSAPAAAEEPAAKEPTAPGVPGAPAAAGALDALAKSKAGGEIVGKATSKVWWYGFSSAAAFFFTGLDFFIGAAVMDVYWVSMHRRQPELFPMKGWQKVVTVVANVLPLVLLFFFISVIMITGCNWPVPKSNIVPTYRGSVIGAFIGDDCKYFDVNNMPKPTNSAPAAQTNSPATLRGP